MRAAQMLPQHIAALGHAQPGVQPVRLAAKLDELPARGFGGRGLMIKPPAAFHHLIGADDQGVRFARG